MVGRGHRVPAQTRPLRTHEHRDPVGQLFEDGGERNRVCCGGECEHGHAVAAEVAELPGLLPS